MVGLKYKKNAMNKIKRATNIIEGGVYFIDAACVCGGLYLGKYGSLVPRPSSGTNNRQVAEPSGTRDKCLKSGTVPEIPGQLEPMYILSVYFQPLRRGHLPIKDKNCWSQGVLYIYRFHCI